MPGPGFPGARGNSRRGLQKPKCLSERNSNFLPKQSLRRRRTGLTLFFLSLFIFQPAGLVILFFSYYKRSQLQHTRKKTISPARAGPCGRSRLAGLLWQTKAAPASGTHWEKPRSPPPTPTRAKATAGVRGGLEKFLPAPNLLLPLGTEPPSSQAEDSRGACFQVQKMKDQHAPSPHNGHRIEGLKSTSWLGNWGLWGTDLPEGTWSAKARADL